MSEPGLYRFNQQVLKRGEQPDNPQAENNRPILLFLHGTFSSTEGSFGRLPQEAWLLLRQQYGDRIFGYDHPTLSLSPAQNALDLVNRLPENARLHLVTHSRGGLIGELLSRSGRTDGKDPFDDIDLKLSAQPGQGEADKENAGRIVQPVEIKTYPCGTVCTGRLPGARYHPGIRSRGPLAGNHRQRLGEGIATGYRGHLWSSHGPFARIEKQAANPEAMPGLAAMMPESGFIRMDQPARRRSGCRSIGDRGRRGKKRHFGPPGRLFHGPFLL
jgi:hypothetical protein